MRAIASLVGVTLDTPHLAAMADFYTTAFGLTPLEPSDGDVALRGDAGLAAQLRLRHAERRGLGGLLFAMRARADVEASATALAQRGIAIVETPGESADGFGFAIRDPDGTLLRFVAIDRPAQDAPPASDHPLFLSHVVLNSPDAPRLTAFYIEMLGFTLSDAYEKGLLNFLRCDQPQHHCVGISPGHSAGLNHFAMDCGAIDTLMRCYGRMQRLGHMPLWGPGRHGPGGNIFCYYQDPDQFVPEFTCDVLQIADPATWTPREWARTPANGNIWDTGAPSPRAVALMSGLVETGGYA